ncbi:MAG: serine/threonine-protein phosphatase [Spirochaetes bacterium]|nr:serine/threonine-protein phosphatase [Spirochaetota bacterium]
METFIEVDHHQCPKGSYRMEGDIFLSKKILPENRVISVLSDGLGSGVKAGVLSTLTATMAITCMAGNVPIERAAQIIHQTLPVCSERRIRYATFTIVDVRGNQEVRILEYDNPPYVLIRDGEIVEVQKTVARLPSRYGRKTTISLSSFVAKPGDRIIVFSDGVVQSGIGTPAMPLGWGTEGVKKFLQEVVQRDPTLSARELAHTVVRKSLWNDALEAKDDITCGVLYFRNPRRALVLTGPPVAIERDKELASIFSVYRGKRIICGGTTATILARELGKQVRVCLQNIDPEVPPASEMEGADLVTEGILTLGKTAELLDGNLQGRTHRPSTKNAAYLLMEQLLNSDIVDFVVGTRINEAHQDPSMPMELEIRRNIVKRIAQLLEERYLKEVHIQFI